MSRYNYFTNVEDLQKLLESPKIARIFCFNFEITRLLQILLLNFQRMSEAFTNVLDIPKEFLKKTISL